MAFESYDELIKMASTDPKKATEYVEAAKQSNRPVVSADNPGYSDDPRSAAIKRQMKKKMLQNPDNSVQNRKELGY
jgi:citrate synthase